MMAKYLSIYGHSVTVIRSGEISGLPDTSLQQLDNVNVISLLGKSSDAERFEHGDVVVRKERGKKIGLIPEPYRKMVVGVYRFLVSPLHIYNLEQRCKQRLRLLRKILSAELAHERFDIVFSTCGNMSIIEEGREAASFYNCTWILDFRDPLVQPLANGWLLNKYLARVQREAINKADAVVAISEGLSDELSESADGKRVYTIHNGYEGDSSYAIYENNKDKLSFCYTGRVYSARFDALESFARILCDLISIKKVDADRLEFIYAGPDGVVVEDVLKKYSLERILVNRGYVTRDVANNIQRMADVFLVLSWNTKYERGVLTGKFYEGIRARKVILSIVVGDWPDSELYRLNEKYKYGFCYEVCNEQSNRENFEKFLIDIYNEKKEYLTVKCKSSENLAYDFSYSNLAKSLECLCNDLMN